MNPEVQYLAIMNEARANGIPFPVGERTGVGRRGVWQRQIRVDLREGFPLVTTKRVSLKWIVAELQWFLSGSTYEPHLRELGPDIWAEWATAEQCAKHGLPEGELGPIYGHAWRNFGARGRVDGVGQPGPRRFDAGNLRWINTGFDGDGEDQLLAMCKELSEKPASTRIMLSGWDPKNVKNIVAPPPCHTLFQVKVFGDGRLCSSLYQRSADLFLGVPYNLASYAMLTRLIAHAFGYEAWEFVHNLADAHVYDNHHEQILDQSARDVRRMPQVVLDPSLKGGGFDAVMAFNYSHVTLTGYDPHPSIKAEVAV